MTNRVRNATKESEQNPASFLAAALVMGGSGAIERQEAQGQAELVQSDVLPVNTGYGAGTDPLFQALGFEFGEPVADDPIFRAAKLPAGWKKRSTDHSMWSDIVDDQGRVRVNVFYKAAFYDRSAHMNLAGRFSLESDPPGSDTWQVADRKLGTVVFVPEVGKDGYAECREWLDKRLGEARDSNIKAWDEP